MLNSMACENVHEKSTVLYFEDDEQTSNLVCEYLENKGYQIIHFEALPDNYSDALTQAAAYQPVIVILDINMPGKDGYEICQILRDSYIDSSVPVIFTSGLMEASDILKAYESGGDDYLTKPVKLSELSVKVSQHLKLKEEVKGATQQLEMANKMAFKAMTASSELGSIMHFNERCIQAKDYESLTKELLEICAQFDLKVSVLIPEQDNYHISNSGNANVLELKTMEILRNKERVYSWDTRTIFNFHGVSLLVRNMPVDDDERYGEIKDLVCLMLNGAESRLKALKIEAREQEQRLRIQKVAESISEMVLDMEQQKLDLSFGFEKIIEVMEQNVSADILQFNLLQNEEQVLMNHIDAAMKQARYIFDRSAENEKHYKNHLSQLLEQIK